MRGRNVSRVVTNSTRYFSALTRKSEQMGNRSKIILDYVLESVGKDKRPYLEVCVFGHRMLGLLDSGASKTVLGRSGIQLVSKFDLLIDRTISDMSVRVANGEKCECVGSVTLPVCLMDKCILLEVLIVPALPHCLILGIDF